ncbi:unnamed protein product, partial [Staurois parvus]
MHGLGRPDIVNAWSGESGHTECSVRLRDSSRSHWLLQLSIISWKLGAGGLALVALREGEEPGEPAGGPRRGGSGL